MKKKGIIFTVLFLFLLMAVIVTVFLFKRYSPSKEHKSLDQYFEVSDGQAKVILEDEICDTTALIDDKGEVYLEIAFIKEHFNNRFYWDDSENVLLYTTSTAVISADLDSADIYTNNSKSTEDYVVVKTDGVNAYVAIDYVKKFSAIDFNVYENPSRVVIRNQYDTDVTFIKTTKKSALRYRGGIKSPILVDLKEKTKLRVLSEADEESGYRKVMTESGVIGYVKNNRLGETFTEQISTEFQPETYSHILLDEKVNLVWHQVTTEAANASLTSMIAKTKGVNVVSPTWFDTADNKGNVNSIASDEYVTTAHRLGLQVWGLCDDFTPGMKIGKVLGSTSTRQKLAKNLIAEAIRYSLDGLNIDFENVKAENGEDFIQFIRELSIMCRNNGIILSIDNYPLRNFNAYYDRAEQAKVADYIITMAYDEFYSGSETAGPVSSISYVKDSISLLEGIVPSNQHIVALPFYSRHWTEKKKNGKVKLSSEALSMAGAQEFVEDSGKKAKWDEATGLYYLEYKKDKTVHKIWVEDEKSLELKMKAVQEAEQAGMAFWKLGLEKDSAWEKIAKYSK